MPSIDPWGTGLMGAGAMFWGGLAFGERIASRSLLVDAPLARRPDLSRGSTFLPSLLGEADAWRVRPEAISARTDFCASCAASEEISDPSPTSP